MDNIIYNAEKGVGLADAKDLINKVTSLFERYSVQLHHCLKDIQCSLENMNLT